jgi:hypothetical protein
MRKQLLGVLLAAVFIGATCGWFIGELTDTRAKAATVASASFHKS